MGGMRFGLGIWAAWVFMLPATDLSQAVDHRATRSDVVGHTPGSLLASTAIRRVEGVVYDAMTLEPIPGAVIAPGWDGDTSIAGVGGEYALEGFPSDTIHFLVTAFGYRPAIAALHDIPASSDLAADIALTPWPWDKGLLPPADVPVIGRPKEPVEYDPYREGWMAALEEIGDSTATIYQYGFPRNPNPVIDVENGLPIQPVAGCIVTPGIQEFVRGHNMAIVHWLSRNGVPEWSRQRWAAELVYPGEYFERRALSETPIILRLDGGGHFSPDGRWWLQVEPVESLLNRIGRLIVNGVPNKREHDAVVPLVEETFRDFFWGPEGADVAVFRIRFRSRGSVEDPEREIRYYYILDLRAGAWLTQIGIGLGDSLSDILLAPMPGTIGSVPLLRP